MGVIVCNTHITDAEWEVMRVVWANDRVTSKKVISVLQEKMDWTQSTIKTILGRLVGKGVLNTEQEGRKFIYTANIEETEAVRDYAEDIFNRFFFRSFQDAPRNLDAWGGNPCIPFQKGQGLSDGFPAYG